MATVSSGGRRLQIDSIVAEAIGSLSYFHPRSLPFVAERIARLWGKDARAFETDGEWVKPLQDKPQYRVASEIWDCLSSKGRADPGYACQATWLRVQFNVRRELQRQEGEPWRSFASTAQFRCHEPHACASARNRQGEVLPLVKRTLLFAKPVPLPALPLAGCDADWCSCRWDVTGD